MKYAYHDLNEDQFERLVECICHHLFGIGVQGFAKGPDGGRDSKFVGTAQLYPSTSAPWTGTTIIQAKHTIGYNKSFSESDFYSKASKSTTMAEEMPRIKKLRDADQLDNYILFANRKLAGNAESEIRSHISKECRIPESSIALCGVEYLERILKHYPQAAVDADLDPIDCPLIVSPDDLAEVVEALARQRESFQVPADDAPTKRVHYEVKNALNNMTPEYAKEIRKKYLKETGQIKAFLEAPENSELLRLYESVVDEFQLQIIAKRRDHQTFDDVMEHIAQVLFSRDAVLRQAAHKRLTRVMLFYMYWNCDIGLTGDDDDAAAD
jgi:hypothetical protein